MRSLEALVFVGVSGLDGSQFLGRFRTDRMPHRGMLGGGVKFFVRVRENGSLRSRGLFLGRLAQGRPGDLDGCFVIGPGNEGSNTLP